MRTRVLQKAIDSKQPLFEILRTTCWTEEAVMTPDKPYIYNMFMAKGRKSSRFFSRFLKNKKKNLQ